MEKNLQDPGMCVTHGTAGGKPCLAISQSISNTHHHQRSPHLAELATGGPALSRPQSQFQGLCRCALKEMLTQYGATLSDVTLP